MKIRKEEEKITEEDSDKLFGLNTRLQRFVAQHVYIYLRKDDCIMLMSFVAAKMPGIPDCARYAGTKAAVEAFV